MNTHSASQSRSRPTGKCRGHTLIEALLALCLFAFFIGAVAASTAVYRSTFRVMGSVQLDGVGYSINPDDPAASQSRALALEFVSLAHSSSYCLAVDAAWDPTQAATAYELPFLTAVPPAAMAESNAMRATMAENGIIFAPNEGFTLWLIGPKSSVRAALTAERHTATTSSGEQFAVYTVRLFGSDTSGQTMTFSYAFASPLAVAQPLVKPTYNAGIWSFGIPDPSAASERPNGTVVLPPNTGLVYEVVSHI